MPNFSSDCSLMEGAQQPDDDTTEILQVNQESDQDQPEFSLRRSLEVTFSRSKILGQVACAMAEVSPVNEMIRYGAFGAVMAGVSHTPEAGALAFGISTLVVEGIGAAAAAPLLETQTSRRFVNYLNIKIARARRDDNLKLSPVTKTVTALVGGSVAAMAVSQLEDSHRTQKNNLRYGLKISTWLAGVCAVQGALMAEGINIGLDHPEVGGIATLSLLGVGSSSYFANKLIRKARVHKV